MVIKMNKSVYLDTTIPSYYYEERLETTAFAEITRKWWDTQRFDFDIFVSDYTIAELNQGEYPNKEKILDLVSETLKFEASDEIDEIAGIYIDQFIMPRGHPGDAYHLACASVMKIDYLLTWNCNHLANVNKERHILIMNTKLGLHVPRICTPLQLFNEED
jgi:predicted nucleic acid-binding protein